MINKFTKENVMQIIKYHFDQVDEHDMSYDRKQLLKTELAEIFQRVKELEENTEDGKG